MRKIMKTNANVFNIYIDLFREIEQILYCEIS